MLQTANMLPDDPRLVELVARGEHHKIILPFTTSLRRLDFVLLILGMVGLATVRHLGDPQVVWITWAVFAAAVVGLMWSSLQQMVEYMMRRERGYVPAALPEKYLLYSGVVDLYFLLGMLLCSIQWLPFTIVGAFLVGLSIVATYRHVLPNARRGAAAVRAAALAAGDEGSSAP